MSADKLVVEAERVIALLEAFERCGHRVPRATKTAQIAEECHGASQSIQLQVTVLPILVLREVA